MTIARPIWLLLCGMIGATANAQDPAIDVELAARQIYLGEDVRYTVVLQNVGSPVKPDLTKFDDFDVKFLGDRSLDSRSITIINGVRRESVRRGHEYVFSLTPRRAGELTVPEPTVVIDGKTLTGEPVTLRVRNPDDQDVVGLEILTSRSSVYPIQPFTVTLNVYVKDLPAAVGGINPVSARLLREPPRLQIPWVIDDELDSGLEPTIPWERWISAMRSDNGDGFAINRLDSNTLSLFRSRTLAFLPEPEKVQRPDAQDRPVKYWKFSFARTFAANTIGEYSFGPVTVKGTFPVPSGGDLVGERVFAVGPAVTVGVKDVPTQGRPDSYSGAIGEFEVESRLSPVKAKVGDPLTFSLIVRGHGTLHQIAAPELASIDELTSHFKVYEATEKTLDDAREFTWSLRPKTAGAAAFPGVPFSYFDTRTEKFATVTTDPIPVEILEAVELSTGDIEVATRPDGAAQVEANQGGVFANITDLSELRRDAVQPFRWLSAFAGLAVAFLGVSLVARRAQRLSGDEDLRRRRGAVSRATGRLRQAVEAMSAGQRLEAADLLRSSVNGLVADACAIPEAGLTSADACRHLNDRQVDAELVGRVSRLLESCDGARYGAEADSLHSLCDDGSRVLDDLVAAFKRERWLS